MQICEAPKIIERTEFVYITQPVDLAARAQAKYKGGNINLLAQAIPASALNKR